MEWYPSHAAALVCSAVAMVLWGSWGNCFKWAQARFELFYIDFALGSVLSTVVMILLLGGQLPVNPGSNFNAYIAAAAGPLFTLGNLLLVSSVELVGLAVAFPLVVGLEFILGTTLLYFKDSSQCSSPAALFGGVAAAMASVLLDSL